MWWKVLFEAFLTCVPLFLWVHCHLMLIKISLLCEGLITIQHFTFEWSFSSVYPQMIKEIMELSKVFLATFIVAAKDFYKPLGLRIFVLIYGKFFSCRDLVLNFNRGQIKFFSLYYFYICINLNQIPDFLAKYLILWYDVRNIL